MSRHSKQGLGFMSHPGANTSRRSVAHHDAAQPFLGSWLWRRTGALNHPAPPCCTPASWGEWAGRREMSALRQMPLFLLLDNFLFHIPFVFLSSSVSFPLQGFVVPFSWPAHSSFPCDSPAGAQHSHKQRTCQGTGYQTGDAATL